MCTEKRRNSEKNCWKRRDGYEKEKNCLFTFIGPTDNGTGKRMRKQFIRWRRRRKERDKDRRHEKRRCGKRGSFRRQDHSSYGVVGITDKTWCDKQSDRDVRGTESECRYRSGILWLWQLFYKIGYIGSGRRSMGYYPDGRKLPEIWKQYWISGQLYRRWNDRRQWYNRCVFENNTE